MLAIPLKYYVHCSMLLWNNKG